MIDEDYIVDRFCGLYPDFLVKPRRGSSAELYVSDILYALVYSGSGPKAADLLNIGEQTFNRLIKKIFPGIKLVGGNQTWVSHILHLVEIYKCSNCKVYKKYVDFYSDSGRHTNKDSVCIQCRTESRNKEYHREYSKNHYYCNKNYYTYKSATYKANKAKRTPKWAELKLIQEFYFNRPEGFHVDHIIPLNGKTVSGLHVLSNLQYLSVEANLAKSNKFDYEKEK